MLSSATWGEQSTEWSGLEHGHGTPASATQGPHTSSKSNCKERKEAQKERARGTGAVMESSYAHALRLLAAHRVIPMYYAWPDSHSVGNLSALPDVCRPVGGHVPPDRVARKEVQVANMLELCMRALDFMWSSDHPTFRHIRVVEFCAGSGFIGLPLAYRMAAMASARMTGTKAHESGGGGGGGGGGLPERSLEVCLVDWKGPSIDIAHERVSVSGLANVRVL